MFKRIKDKFESVAYAGLKPTTPGASKEVPVATTAFGRFRDKVDKLLAGPGASDPLYLTNRTLWQKLRPILVISLPILVLLGGLGLGLMNILGLNKPYQPPPPSMSSAEIARRSLPVLNQDLHVTSQHDVDIQDVIIPPGSSKLQGIAKNMTDHEIRSVHVIFDLTDRAGSRQGAVSTDVENIASKTAKTFSFPIPQKTAAFAIVRDVQIN